MSWLERIRSGSDPGAAPPAPSESGPEAGLRRGAPGLGALYEGLRKDGGHAILDFGPASPARLGIHGLYARQVRFADLLPHPPRGEALVEALLGLGAARGKLYDVVLLWDVLDRLLPGERERVIRALVGVTAPAARLHAIVDASERPERRPLLFTMVDESTVLQAPAGPSEGPGRPILPAQMERLLDPWEVARAFTIRGGFREYLAVRR